MSEASRAENPAAEALDLRILACIEQWHRGDVVQESEIDALALDVFRYQLAHNGAYRRYVEYLEVDLTQVRDPRAVPAVPASAFKDAELTTFPAAEAALHFRTSGTTAARRGSHYLASSALYDASALAIFDRLVLSPRGLLGDGSHRLRFLSLVPDPVLRPDSSLGYMVAHLIRARGDGRDRQLLGDGDIDLGALREAVAQAHEDGVTLCIFATALALLNVLEALGTDRLLLPRDSLLIETGGFKGVKRETSRAELYTMIETAFALENASVIAEFGMTELTSQYYDSTASAQSDLRVKIGPPWLRPLIVDAAGNEVAPGQVGALRHLDLCNRSSVMAITTEDLAVRYDGGFVLLGRERHAELRGCSLDAETLRVMEREG